ncbi:MAG: SpoIIE family protein phosphatase [Bacteroidetes bacterium]|nr:SpoIIE family protein phosphatase [Bacteroidota bacterium]
MWVAYHTCWPSCLSTAPGGLKGLLSFSFIGTIDPYHKIAFFGSLFVILCFFLVITLFKRLNLIRKLLSEKEESLALIAQQKLDLEIREKSITDSLLYAQRIQEARLPSEDYFRDHFPSSFIFFKPKDIVSGDFYWIGEKDEWIFIVAADCTGHGVSGALMSMIGMEIIENAISEDNIVSPSKILSSLNLALEKTFSRKKNIGTIIRDGMDVGICAFNGQSKKIIYSGAFIPLYLLRNNSLNQISGDKIIIGMNPGKIPYTEHEIEVQDDDMIYLFSDGYVDQFGGKDNKKFMYRRLRYLLLTIHKFDIIDQKSILEENLRTWMGTNTQVDDIMIIGFKPSEKIK